MKKEKLGQELAFPLREEHPIDRESNVEHHLGISKRYWTAVMMAQGIMAGAKPVAIELLPKGFAQLAYSIADALLEQENK